MYDRYEIENIILGMAEIVKENRALREVINELQLECEKYKAYFFGDSAKAEILSDIIMNNASVRSMQAAGWLTNQEYIEDWESELEKRMATKESVNEPDKSLESVIKSCEEVSKEGTKRDCKEKDSIDKDER